MTKHGALWMLIAGLLFACMGVFVKLGAAYFSNIELVFYRSFIGLFVVYALIRQQRGSLRTPHWRSHAWRGVSGSIALLLFFYCITVLPLATAVTLNYTSPLFLTLLTVWLFREHFHLPLVAAILLGFIGTILLLHPTLQKDQIIPGLLGLASGFLAGVAMFNVRQLGRLGEPEWRVVFYFSLIASVFGAIGMTITDTHPVTVESIPLLLGLGISATLAQLALTRAYSIGSTLVVSTLSYSTIVFASIFGIILWNETLPVEGWVGMALIITSGVLSFRTTPRLSAQKGTL
ncbi:MAG: DMT family transporter [Gallionellaceae bacterium]|jgi:drug/metabolite transporter (DMT)-like permease